MESISQIHVGSKPKPHQYHQIIKCTQWMAEAELVGDLWVHAELAPARGGPPADATATREEEAAQA